MDQPLGSLSKVFFDLLKTTLGKSLGYDQLKLGCNFVTLVLEASKRDEYTIVTMIKRHDHEYVMCIPIYTPKITLNS